jgi:hypothetical protein
LGLFLVATGILGLYNVYAQSRSGFGITKALEIAEDYTESLGNPDLHVAEVMEFEDEFYFIVYEESTGIGAKEMLLDKATGRVYPEPGPNMMWNTGYGHMGVMAGGMMGGSQGSGPPMVKPDEAVKLAQAYLDQELPGMIAEEPFPFYGYYTLHVMNDGGVHGMLSVNAYYGNVWFHDWHGQFIESIENH